MCVNSFKQYGWGTLNEVTVESMIVLIPNIEIDFFASIYWIN